MPVTMTCRRCDIPISADNEDELVARVQDHVRTHPGMPELTGEHVLARLHRLQVKQAERRT